MDFCQQHIDLVKERATDRQILVDLKTSFDEIKERMVAHINDGEKEGGVRDRVKVLETENKVVKLEMESLSESISALKKAEWKRVVVAGVIGGVVSRSPDVWGLLINLIR